MGGVPEGLVGLRLVARRVDEGDVVLAVVPDELRAGASVEMLRDLALFAVERLKARGI